MVWLKYLVVICFLVVRSHAVDSLRFIVIGDVGGQELEPYSTFVERSTAKEMGRIADIYKPMFIMELGDNFYENGVTNVTDKRFQETFESVFTAPSLQVPWYFIAGNHDHHGNVSAQIEYSKISKRWNFPYYYYYLEMPITKDVTIGIVMIDTVTLCGNTGDNNITEEPNVYEAKKQWTFIEQTLRHSKTDFLFLAGHYPIYSISFHGPSQCLINDLLPIMEKYRVNGYFCAHDHTLQHLRTKSTNGNIDHFISGMASSISPSTAHKDAVPAGSSLFFNADVTSKGGFLYVEVTPRNMTLTFINSKGKRLHTAQVIPRK